jgi:triosephosphate isomerase
MHNTSARAAILAREISHALENVKLADVAVVLVPPFTALEAVGAEIITTRIALGAQNMHWLDEGAYTGEIAPPMLADLGVRYVILGHSERRRYFHETDADVNRKVHAALAHDLVPIVAVGETAEERDAGQTDERVVTQTRAAFEGIAPQQLRGVVVAYEPVWAIGTGKNCDAAEADRVMRLIAGSVAALDGAPILYGGSVTTANFAAYLAMPHCHGGLIGGASLSAESFAKLVHLAIVTA